MPGDSGTDSISVFDFIDIVQTLDHEQKLGLIICLRRLGAAKIEADKADALGELEAFVKSVNARRAA